MSTQFLETREGKIAYEETGQGPLVICVPSMGDLRGEYRFLAPQLASAGYRVVSMDVRGHGETSVSWPDYSVGAIGADVLDLVRSLDAGPAVLVGDSMAGGAVIWADVEAPDLVAALVLIDPIVRGEGSALSRLVLSVLFTRLWGPALWQRYYAMLYPARKPEDFAQYSAKLRANLEEPGRLKALSRMMTASKAASAERVSRVTAPALVVMGSKDLDFKDPEGEARDLGKILKARVEIVPGAGHYPHAEMPEVTGPIILSFLQALHEPSQEKPAGETGSSRQPGESDGRD